MEAHHAVALDRAISPDRLRTYLAEAGGDPGLARELYVWDRDLAASMLADIAILEVALRNALNTQLTVAYGTQWYSNPALGLEDRSSTALSAAWRNVPPSSRTPGRLVAQLMFGFWVGLLDSGGTIGKPPRQYKHDYEDLWRGGLYRAFPGGKKIARDVGGQFSRTFIHGIAHEVKAVRNRAAHHEPLLRGIPIPGQRRRITPQEGHDQVRRLLATIDRDLLAWLDDNTTVPTMLQLKP